MEQNKVGIVQLFKELKNKNIRFNPRPFSNPTVSIQSSNVLPTPEGRFIDRHAEIVSKVDALISELEAQNRIDKTVEFEEPDVTTKTNSNTSLDDLMTNIKP